MDNSEIFQELVVALLFDKNQRSLIKETTKGYK